MNIENIFNILIFVIFIIISYIDIKEKIISDMCILMLFIFFIIEIIKKNNYIMGITGMGIIVLPFLLLYSLEDYVKKSLIGFGDIKLVSLIGGFLGSKYLENDLKGLFFDIVNYYKILYIISGIFSVMLLILKKNKRDIYLPFAPFIILAYNLEGVWNI